MEAVVRRKAHRQQVSVYGRIRNRWTSISDLTTMPRIEIISVIEKLAFVGQYTRYPIQAIGPLAILFLLRRMFVPGRSARQVLHFPFWQSLSYFRIIPQLYHPHSPFIKRSS